MFGGANKWNTSATPRAVALQRGEPLLLLATGGAQRKRADICLLFFVGDPNVNYPNTVYFIKSSFAFILMPD